MSRLPQLFGRACIAILERHGFRVVRQNGSHMRGAPGRSFFATGGA